MVAQQREQARPDGDRALAPVLQEHLGTDPRGIAVVGEELPAYRFVDSKLDVFLNDRASAVMSVFWRNQRKPRTACP